MDYKKEIQSIIDEKGKKSCSRAIKNNEILWNEILKKTHNIQTNNIMERVNAYLKDISSLTCKNGNDLKYKDGNFIFCGKANKCACAKEQISESVKKSKANRSKEDIEKENKKREQTVFEKSNGEYTNNGQSKDAKQKHSDFYNDVEKVKNQTLKHQKTMFERYGSNNSMKVDIFKDKARKTCLKKYNVDNPMKDKSIKNRSIKNRSLVDIDISSNFDRIKKRLLDDSNIKILTSSDDYIGVASRPLWLFECNSCSNQFEKRFDYASLPICRICNPLPITYKSNEELELLDFIKENYSGTIISGDRKILKGKELDIYLPDINLAIEYCGLYWHSENSAGKKYKYHYNKYKECKDSNIQLLTIFSDEWTSTKEIVKNCLLSKIKKQKRIFARKCEIKIVQKSDVELFLNTYHLQGCPNKITKSIGLYFNNELISIMSFLIKENKAELIRFASVNEVIGGASRLLKDFIRNNPTITEITSFSDNRWSNGNLYFTLGFDKVSDVPPMQYYVEKYQKRYHKRYFNKNRLNKLIDCNFGTEWEKLQELGYDRIWDCGKIKFVLNITQ